MYNDSRANESVEDGGARPSDEGSHDEGNECDGEGTFEGPVIGSMGFVWLRDFDRIVDCSLNYLWRQISASI